jgi:hypothetical protein
VIRVACWAQVYRKFYEFRTTAPVPDHEAARLVPAPVDPTNPVAKRAVGELKRFHDEHGSFL